MIRFIAHFDGQKLSPDEPVNLPTGQPLQVTVEEVPKKDGDATFDFGSWLQDVANRIGPIDKPEDWAANHDRYIAEDARGHRDGE
jgi:hypothetical protein